jgi:hypothetical protein
MKRIVIVFGLISGLIASAMMFITMPLVKNGTLHDESSYIVGYASIFLAFLLVFFGIRQYRENNGGTISFGRGVAVGLLITLISCAFYIASWQIIYFKFMPDFMDKYSASAVKNLREKGASPAEITAKEEEMKKFKTMYDNPLINAAVTFIEPFPVGLLMTLVSAAILRRRTPSLPTLRSDSDEGSTPAPRHA